MASNPIARLKARTELAEKRIAERKLIEKEFASTAEESSLPPKKSPAENMVSEISRHNPVYVKSEITTMEQLGLFEAIPVEPRDALPTLLTRLPIFMCINAATQKKLLNNDNAFEFTTPFGNGRRYGPNLTIFDEDVFMAMARLREKKLLGHPDKLPIKQTILSNLDDKGRCYVDVSIFSRSQIREELGYKKSGKTNKDIDAAIERLGTVSIVFDLNKHERYLGDYKKGEPIKLVDVKWEKYSQESVYYVQFSPIATYWFDNHFTYINWEMRKALGRNYKAKALMNYLSSQPASHSRDIISLADSIGLIVPTNRIKSYLEDACKALKEVGFLADFEFVGTGRNKPYDLITLKN